MTEILRAFWKEKRPERIAVLVSGILFAVIFWIYEIPVEIAGYAFLLVILWNVIWFTLVFIRYEKRQRILEENQGKIRTEAGGFPEAESRESETGQLNTRTVRDLNRLMEKRTGELLVVLEDQRKPLEKLFTANPSFKKKFTSKLELPVFINDELVTFGQTYAKENGYKLDEMGILALYSRIDVMQREDHAVTVAEVKEIMDDAIDHSQKANVKHLARRVFGKSTDSSDRIILKEEDFKI